MTADDDLRRAAHAAYSHDNRKHVGMGCTPTDHMLDLARAALAARSEPRSCDPREHGGKHAPWCHAARSEPRAEGLREALTQARYRLDDIFNAMHPGDYTEDELHGIAQNAYFGSEEIDRALAATPPAEGPHPSLTDDPDYFPSTEYERGYADGRAATPPAEGLDVERLARAYAQAGYGGVLSDEEWQDIAREYAALAPEQPDVRYYSTEGREEGPEGSEQTHLRSHGAPEQPE